MVPLAPLKFPWWNVHRSHHFVSSIQFNKRIAFECIWEWNAFDTVYGPLSTTSNSIKGHTFFDLLLHAVHDLGLCNGLTSFIAIGTIHLMFCRIFNSLNWIYLSDDSIFGYKQMRARVHSSRRTGFCRNYTEIGCDRVILLNSASAPHCKFSSMQWKQNNAIWIHQANTSAVEYEK